MGLEPTAPWIGFGSGISGVASAVPEAPEEEAEAPPIPRVFQLDDDTLASLISSLGEEAVLRVSDHLKDMAERALS